MEKETYNPQIDEFINEEEEELREELEKETEGEKKNPFKALTDFYTGTVKEKDELGFSDIFKRETKRFLTKLDAYLKEYYKLSFTPEDVKYLNGYFLFGHGSNSVVHFHVKEAPGWLFGIWWSPIEIIEAPKAGEPARYYQDKIRCEFFAQYEETIDKFKPSASMFEDSFYWEFEKPGEEENLWRMCFNARRVVLLILQYPYIAFVREIHGQDLNEEYITPEEAEQIYQDWRLRENAIKSMERKNEMAMIECIKTIWKPWIDSGDAFIATHPDISPRYELVIRNIWKDDEDQEDFKDGCYDIFDFGVEWPDKAEDKALWDKTIAECEARAAALDTYWFNEFSHCLLIISGDQYWKYKIKEEERNHD